MLNLILVEDNPADVNFFRMILKKHGVEHTLYVFNSGDAARDYFDAGIDTGLSGIVLDLNIPNFNGFQLLSWLRSDTRYSNVPVAVLSTSDSRNDMDRVIQNNASFYTKSFTLAEVENTVVNIIEEFTVR